jgi:Pro-kumamolisin, activation domain
MNLHRVVVRGFLLFFFSISQFGGTKAGAQVRPQVVQVVDNAQRVTLVGNVHPLARAANDRGAVAESMPMSRMLLLLKRSDEQESALQAYMEQQQSKSSPNYHAWLSPQEFGAQYGPADADIQAVADWLTQQGFTIGKVYAGKTVIEFSGTASQVQSAFGTAIHNFAVNGKMYSANTTDPQIPAALAPVVYGLVSLNSFPRQSHARRVGQVRKAKGKAGLEPLRRCPRGLRHHLQFRSTHQRRQ